MLPEQAEEDLPLVSVITPTRNRLRFIPQLISGFFAQDWPNKELIIVSDGEGIEDLMDGTRFFADGPEPILHIRHESTKPHAAARIAEALNLGVRAARGMYCVRFDDDDWQASGRISQQVAMLSMTGKGVVAGSSGLFLTESGEVFEYSGSRFSGPGQGENDPPFQMVEGELIINLRKSDNWRRVPLERIAAIAPLAQKEN
jgi:glycosyltransferase involved in cell wall biosynthesis